MRGEEESRWWGNSALILLIAPVALIFWLRPGRYIV